MLYAEYMVSRMQRNSLYVLRQTCPEPAEGLMLRPAQHERTIPVPLMATPFALSSSRGNHSRLVPFMVRLSHHERKVKKLMIYYTSPRTRIR